MVYSNNELKKLAEILKKYPNTIVISDEIYEHINFTNKKMEVLGSFYRQKNKLLQ